MLCFPDSARLAPDIVEEEERTAPAEQLGKPRAAALGPRQKGFGFEEGLPQRRRASNLKVLSRGERDT